MVVLSFISELCGENSVADRRFPELGDFLARPMRHRDVVPV
jgi:hypothetical protein